MTEKKRKSEKPTKPAEPPKSEPAKSMEADVLALMQKLAENGIGEVSSRLVSDKLGLEPDKGRQRVRALMKRLEKDGKVEVGQKEVGKRKQYIYRLKESREG